MATQKICTLETLKNRLHTDLQLVFTHGAFDLFHHGHLELLKKSKEMGGKLIVGVDHDDSIHTYKKSRTIFHQEYRMHMIARLDFVDYILPLRRYSETDDVDYYFLKLYLLLKPTFITYGMNFPFIEAVNEKCRLANIQSKQILHRYSSDVSTTRYALSVVRGYVESDLTLYEKPDQK